MKKTGVGIMDASSERGWAVWAHVPLPHCEIRAVSTSQRESSLIC